MPTHFDGLPEQVLALDTYIKLTRAVSAFETRMLSHGSLGELTPSQFGVLEVLLHLGPMCQGTISRKLLKSTGNITLVLDNLEKLGLVKRIRSDEDRRMVMVELTQEGRALIEQVFPVHAEIITEEMSILTPEEQTQLGRICRKLGRGFAETG